MPLQTTTPLTAHDIQLLKSLKKGLHTGLLMVSIMFLIGGGILLAGSASEPVCMPIGLILLIIGAFALRSAMGMYKKREQFPDTMRYTITGRLQDAYKKGIRTIGYQVDGEMIELYIPIPYKTVHRYYFNITAATILSDITVTLSYTQFYPGAFILLDISYDQYSYEETTTTLQQEDIERLRPQRFFGTTQDVGNAHSKIIIRTTIMEILEILTDDDDTGISTTHYRLGNGTLLPVTVTGGCIGDNILIQFLVKQDGTIGPLISITTQ